MARTLVVLLMALLPFAGAHYPPGPDTTCQPLAAWSVHDYLLQGGGGKGTAYDGASVCAPPAVGDGELDHGYGGVALAVRTGDGVTHGAWACYGMVGHHSNDLAARGWPSNTGPAFTVSADHSRVPPPPGPSGGPPDCGDGVIEPCAPGAPPGTCNPNDCVDAAPANPAGDSTLSMACPAGVDGVYWVTIDPGSPDGAGHVWSDWPPGPPPACANGVDDDGDQFVDYPTDLGCSSAADTSE